MTAGIITARKQTRMLNNDIPVEANDYRLVSVDSMGIATTNPQPIGIRYERRIRKRATALLAADRRPPPRFFRR